MYEYV